MSTLESSDHVIVVGAGLAGWRFVEALRREGYAGAISLVGEERHAPYDRPPLSKQVLLGKWDLDKTVLATPELIGAANVELHLGVAATGLDVATTTVHLSDGSSLAGTHVVIATGCRARRLGFDADEQIHTLRSRDDLARLNDELSSLAPASVVAIIGGGFIGAEAATALFERGYRPIVLEAVGRPLVNVVGEEASRWLIALAGNFGVELRTRQRISNVVESDGGFTVMFDNASELRAPVVIVSAGAVANDQWLATSGLLIDNGVVVNEHLVASDRVGAIGDVARFVWNSSTGPEFARIEHWQVANEHAASLAHYWMTGDAPPVALVPYFWSDQYGKKIQMLGHPRASDNIVRVSVSDDAARWVALYSRDAIVTGIVTLGQPRALMLSKWLLEEPTTLDEALARAPWAS